MDAQVSLYGLLGVDPQASTAEIRKSFRLMALKVHPDKNPNDPVAAKNFQALNAAYRILTDPMKRNMYDLTGDVEESEDFSEAYNYYRDRYHQVTPEAINDFAATYKNSEMEREDLISYYLDYDGDMSSILLCVPLSEREDLPRFWKIYAQLIKSKQLPRKRAYTSSKKNVMSVDSEIGDDIEKKKELKAIRDSDLSSLVSAIKNRNNGGDFMGYLEEKYTGKRKINK